MKTSSFYRVIIRHKRFCGVNEIVDVIDGTVPSATKKAMRYLRTANPAVLSKSEFPGVYIETVKSQGKIVL